MRRTGHDGAGRSLVGRLTLMLNTNTGADGNELQYTLHVALVATEGIMPWSSEALIDNPKVISSGVGHHSKVI